MDFSWISNLAKKSSGLIGLEISSSKVKLLELSQGAQGYRIESYAVEPLPPGAMQDHEIKDMEAVGAAINRGLRRSQSRSKSAAVMVHGSGVITKVIQMSAALTEHEVAIQIQLEAERHIPFPLAEVNLDFQIMGPSAKNPDLVDVLLAASRTEIVDNLVEVLSLGGLTAKVVDIEAYALERALCLIADQIPNEGENQTIALVDIGETMTTFGILRDRVMIYTREQMFGGKQLTEEIQRRYGLTFEEANLAKKLGGLPEDYLGEILEPFKESVVQQVSRFLQFFFSSSDFVEVNYIVLAGGTATLSGLMERVEEKLEISTLIANPFLNMSIAPRVNMVSLFEDAPILMTCCGLALRNFSHAHQY